jgi:hypothetical protein
VQRGRRVNSPRSDLPGMPRERHDASDFESQRGRQVDWVMRKKHPAHYSRGLTAKRSQATAVIGKGYRFVIANWLAERLNMTSRRMSASGRYVRLATAWSKAPISR